MICTIDKTSSVPESEQLESTLRDRLMAGELRPGQRMPSPATLARQLRIPRVAVQRAYVHLIDDGWLKPDGDALIVQNRNHTAEAATPAAQQKDVNHTPGKRTNLLSCAATLPAGDCEYAAQLHTHGGTGAEWARVSLIICERAATPDSLQEQFIASWMEEHEDVDVEPAALLTSLNMELIEEFGCQGPPVRATSIYNNTTRELPLLARTDGFAGFGFDDAALTRRFQPELGDVPGAEYEQISVAADSNHCAVVAKELTEAVDSHEIGYSGARVERILENKSLAANQIRDQVAADYQQIAGKPPWQHGIGSLFVQFHTSRAETK